MALACLTIFHGNSDAERRISSKHDLDSFEKRNCLSDMTRRNLLLSRSYLEVRKATAAADIDIKDNLIEMGNKAFSEYQKAMVKQRKEEEEKVAKLKAKEEEERMKEIARKDKERKTELGRIKSQEDDLAKKKKEAESKAIEAERMMQKAIEEKREATKEKVNVAESLSICTLEIEKFERNTMEKAANRVLLEARQLKRKAEVAELESLPSISKKKKSII